MSFISDNIIPGKTGKVFGTNANTEIEMQRIKEAVTDLEGVQEVITNNEVFPKEFTVYTTKILPTDRVEKAVIKTGLHAVPKSLFKL